MEDRVSGDQIQTIHGESRRCYGSPLVVCEVRARGRRCSQKRVIRLMRERQNHTKTARKFHATTDSAYNKPVA